jgi:hypothetical protein
MMAALILGISAACGTQIRPIEPTQPPAAEDETSLQTNNERLAQDYARQGKVASPLGPYSYSFDGVDDDGKSCSTGPRNFDSPQMMCIHMQDPVKNRYCAFEDRVRKFRYECEPLGMDFYEAHSCYFALLTKEADDPSLDKPIPPSSIIQEYDFCTGYRGDGELQDVYMKNLKPQPDITAEVLMKFYPRQQWGIENSPGRSSFKMLIRQNHGSALHRPMTLAYEDGESLQFGFLPGERFKYVLYCHNDWACDKGREPAKKKPRPTYDWGNSVKTPQPAQ